MQEQQRLYEMINEVAVEAEQKMRRLVATERAVADQRVRDQAAAFARRSRSDACATSPAQPASQARQSQTLASVLAELLGELDQMTGVYAAEADRARIAG